VELVNRMVDRGFILREPGSQDRREVLIRLTDAGERTLRELSLQHQTELHKTGPQLMKALEAVLTLTKGNN
jgi:DNA-binding MarR family transcriptional regulator